MKKKTILLLVALSLVAMPLFAQAAEFTLGGWVKLEAMWNSTQTNKDLLVTENNVPRNNSPLQHGRFIMTAENTRMWFIIKGPKLWGAQTTGYIEWDFDSDAGESNGLGLSYSANKPRLGLRHAFFRLNWPETELLMGQYWSLLSEEFPETAQFAPVQGAGWLFLRVPQVRLTQQFMGTITASLAIEEAVDPFWGLTPDATQGLLGTQTFTGQSSETPRVEARVKYEQDLWGKAPFFGKPRPFSARLAAGWQRDRYRAFATGAGGLNATAPIFGAGNFGALSAAQRDQQYLDHWVVEASVFVPIIPTYSNNLAGTLSMLTQWWIGQGTSELLDDMPQAESYLVSPGPLNTSTAASRAQSDRKLLQKWGGFVQLTYYFTNEWFLNAIYGIHRAFGVDRATWIGLPGAAVAAPAIGTIAGADPVNISQQVGFTLWYRPIEALKFGVSYQYTRNNFFQPITTGSQVTSLGENHQIMFAGFFFF